MQSRITSRPSVSCCPDISEDLETADRKHFVQAPQWNSGCGNLISTSSNLGLKARGVCFRI